MRVLLVWPNSRNEVLGWGDLGAVAEPLALEYLAAGARADGHECEILDLRLHSERLEAALERVMPDVVAFTAFSMHVLTVVRLAHEVKQARPDVSVVVGGHHATLLPEDFQTASSDFIVCGEGIRPFRAILAQLGAGTRAPIPGVWQRIDGSWTYGGDQEPFAIDELLLPDRSTTTRDRDRYFIDWMRPVALVRTSVGCPYRCTFCSLWQIMGGRYHMRDIGSVVEEIGSIAEPFVFLVDDEAFINGRRMRALATAIADAGLRKRFFAYCRIDTIIRQRDALAAWRDVGLERLFVGIDGISERNLTAYNKAFTIAQIERGLDVALDLGLEIFAQFVVPLDADKRTFTELVRFIEHRDIRYPSFTVLTPLPGTSLLDFDRVTARQPNGRPDWDLFDCQNAVMETALPPADFRKQYRNLYRVFKGSYTQYREHSRVIDPAFHDGIDAAAHVPISR